VVAARLGRSRRTLAVPAWRVGARWLSRRRRLSWWWRVPWRRRLSWRWWVPRRRRWVPRRRPRRPALEARFPGLARCGLQSKVASPSRPRSEWDVGRRSPRSEVRGPSGTSDVGVRGRKSDFRNPSRKSESESAPLRGVFVTSTSRRASRRTGRAPLREVFVTSTSRNEAASRRLLRTEAPGPDL
jgi:hypothetical protein